jgi:hypothetical protein
MTERERTKLLTRLLKHLHIGLGAIALVLLAMSVHGSAGGGAVLAEVAHVADMASSEVVHTLDSIDEKFDLSEPVYRGTDRGDAILILAVVFSSIIAFNLWLFRHLHCVYAPLMARHALRAKI